MLIKSLEFREGGIVPRKKKKGRKREEERSKKAERKQKEEVISYRKESQTWLVYYCENNVIWAGKFHLRAERS